MPIPFLVIGGAAALVAAAAGAGGAHLSLKKIRDKSLLIVGPHGDSTSAVVSILGDDDVEVRPKRARRWTDRVVSLGALRLQVEAPESDSDDDNLATINASAGGADLVALVAPAAQLANTEGAARAERYARLVGELAGDKTAGALVITHDEAMSSSEAAEMAGQREARRLRDLIGASAVIACNPDDPGTKADVAEALLSALALNPRESGE